MLPNYVYLMYSLGIHGCYDLVSHGHTSTQLYAVWRTRAYDCIVSIMIQVIIKSIEIVTVKSAH